MKLRTLLPMIFAALIVALSMLGCTISTTLTLEDEYDIRIVNRTGERVKVRLDDYSYRYLDDDCYIVISSVDSGYHEIEWEGTHSRTKIRPSEVFRFEIDADIEIVFDDDSDVGFIIIEY